MKRAVRFFLWVGIGTLSLVPWAFAQNVTLTSAGSNVYDGVYVSPYYATVNGATNTPIVCDDFSDDSHLNTSWTGNIQSFSSLSSSLASTAWGSVPNAVTLYEEAAWLTLTVLQQASGSTGQDYYSYAVWAVFDPGQVLSWLSTHNPDGSTSPDNNACSAIFGASCASVNLSALTSGYLYNAQHNLYSLSEFSNVVLITPLLANGSTCTAGGCPEQEFIAMVPEGGPAIAYFLLASLCCFGAMFLRSRRQIITIPAA